MLSEDLYRETHRPQFHFTARRGWLNDPNGLVFHDGEYHLFFQHNPASVEWGNMTWGHAVSDDLVRWRQLDNAIRPYGGGTIFSGSVVVDHGNSSELGRGNVAPLVALFTHARPPFGQALAYSLDRGRAWSLFESGRHVVGNQGLDAGERDPKVFWHEASRKWVMVLWVAHGKARLFHSDNLKEWRHASDFDGDGFFECPDLFEADVDGEPAQSKWVLHDAALRYWVGTFDGTTFRPEAGSLRGDLGGNFYAAQTWNNVDRRRIQIAWMRGGTYPGMPFNQQMSFPCTLSLRRTAAGLRLCRWPVREIEALYAQRFEWRDVAMGYGDNAPVGIEGSLFDAEIDLRIASGSVGVETPGPQIICSRLADGYRVSCGAENVHVSDFDGRLHLRLLVDRTSLEVFANRGEGSMSFCFLPGAGKNELNILCRGGSAVVQTLVLHHLRSIWECRRLPTWDRAHREEASTSSYTGGPGLARDPSSPLRGCGQLVTGD
jgi:sucrose-6-phosphate hydrolase SacC (GH32 family)